MTRCNILDRFTHGIIRRKVNQLIGRVGFTRQNREDLEQELYVHLLRRMHQFNPARAHLYAFITTVVERQVANILRHRRAEKRDDRRVSSLNIAIETTDEGPTEIAETLDEDVHDARFGYQSLSVEEHTDLALDMADLIASLPPETQTMLRLLKHMNMTDVAREMGVPRTTLIGRMRHVRQRFEQVGMQKYLR